MDVSQYKYTPETGWQALSNGKDMHDAQLVVIFGASQLLKKDSFLNGLRELFPGAIPIGCSTAGEIAGTAVLDNSLIATAVRFDKTSVRYRSVAIGDAEESYD